MNTTISNSASPTTWFVGSTYHDDSVEQLPRFLEEGIWENGYEDRYLEEVRSMKPGDRIAVKSAYTRKHNLPFDNDSKAVSVMAIKAIGVVTANLDDGRHVQVQWETPGPAREWYFYTNRRTVWCPKADDWMNRGLIAFAFDGKPQELSRFLEVPYWKERYGKGLASQRFAWTAFYEAVAEKLVPFQHDRAPLVEAIHEIAKKNELTYLQDRFADDTTGPLTDICPFTAMGIFNRSMTPANRTRIAGDLAAFLGIDGPIPTSFAGVPTLNNQSSWFFSYSFRRGPGDIDTLWRVFVAGHALVSGDAPSAREEFVAAYDAALKLRVIKWNLSSGLYWSHPWDFPTLDTNSRTYIDERLNAYKMPSARGDAIDGASYLELIDTLRTRFLETNYPVHSFPELSDVAWHPQQEPETDDPVEVGLPNKPGLVKEPAPELYKHTSLADPYSLQDMLEDGCFLTAEELRSAVSRLREKKNVILQGPPGTGKTWLAKRLAYALIGRRDDRKVRAVQFHPNLSYEDFVRGWRPTGDGKLTLADGVFMEAIKAAANDAEGAHVVVIEEINRGNPAQIFGELLTLLEAGKRTPSEALELCYPDADGIRRPVHIPENLHVIGTMNLADRSLALVDLALRRRFAFIDLEPRINATWRAWVVDKRNVDAALASNLADRMAKLNSRIADDPRLGKQYRIGHSYVTPTAALEANATREWFRRVAETEIVPLLEEYWFDEPNSAETARNELLNGW